MISTSGGSPEDKAAQQLNDVVSVAIFITQGAFIFGTSMLAARREYLLSLAINIFPYLLLIPYFDGPMPLELGAAFLAITLFCIAGKPRWCASISAMLPMVWMYSQTCNSMLGVLFPSTYWGWGGNYPNDQIAAITYGTTTAISLVLFWLAKRTSEDLPQCTLRIWAISFVVASAISSYIVAMFGIAVIDYQQFS